MQKAELVLDTGVTHHFEAEMIDSNIHDTGALNIKLCETSTNQPIAYKAHVFGPGRWVSISIWEDDNAEH